MTFAFTGSKSGDACRNLQYDDRSVFWRWLRTLRGEFSWCNEAPFDRDGDGINTGALGGRLKPSVCDHLIGLTLLAPLAHGRALEAAHCKLEQQTGTL